MEPNHNRERKPYMFTIILIIVLLMVLGNNRSERY